jgi:hypothetical protein
MNNLSLKTQGIRGGTPQYKEKVGSITAFLRHSEDRIVIDDFTGSGNTYKKREQTLIEIYDNGQLLFAGTKQELFEILRG